jgi:hypothetical protein
VVKVNFFLKQADDSRRARSIYRRFHGFSAPSTLHIRTQLRTLVSFNRLDAEMLKLVSGENTALLPFSLIIAPLAMVVLCGWSLHVIGADAHRVRTEVEINGSIRLNAGGQRVQTKPLVARGDLAYDQQLVSQGSAARYYVRAEGEATLGKLRMRRSLRSSHRSIGVEISPSGLQFESPSGPLTRDELDVLEVQFDPLLLRDLVPSDASKVGATRRASDDLVASIFFIDVIHQNEVVCEVVESRNSKATIRVKGKASGAVDGVSTEIAVTGQLRFNLDSATIERVALTISENRSIGHASPGFDVTATINSTIVPIATSPHLTAEIIEAVSKQFKDQDDSIAYSSERAEITLLHDARWKVMVDRPEALILRIVDQGDLIGQCNISRLRRFSNDEQLSLEQFKIDVRQALGENFGQVLESSRLTTTDGRIVLRVAVHGTASDLAVNWVYYHVSDSTGRRVSLVFTSEADLASRFAQADVALVNSLRFHKSAPKSSADAQVNEKAEQADTRSGASTRRE